MLVIWLVETHGVSLDGEEPTFRHLDALFRPRVSCATLKCISSDAPKSQPAGQVKSHVCSVIWISCMLTSPTLDTLGEISEIEDVVGLGWSRQQIYAQTVINLHGCVHNLTGAVLHLLGKIPKETFKDGLEACWETKGDKE